MLRAASVNIPGSPLQAVGGNGGEGGGGSRGRRLRWNGCLERTRKSRIANAATEARQNPTATSKFGANSLPVDRGSWSAAPKTAKQAALA